MKSKVVLCISAFLLATPALAQDDQTYAFYRGPDGKVSNHTKDQARQMLAYAKEHGQITLWLVLKYPYNVDFDNMTPQELSTQEAEVSLGFSDLLAPLLASGDAWHPNSGVFIRGPGCTVRATHKGLKQLLRDQRLYQITTFD